VAIVLVLAPAAALAQTEGLNCEHFANQETAQAILNAHGDLYGHDPDGDGVACEDLGGGTAEDGTLAPFAQYAQQYQYASGAPAELADTGGPSLVMPAAAGTLVLGACVVGLFLLAARRGARVGDLLLGGGRQQMAIDDLVGPNAKRLAAVVVAVAVAVVLAAVVGQATTRSASAQAVGELTISKSVHPSPTNAIPVGTSMDFLITMSRNSSNPSPSVTTFTDTLPGGVEFVSANASQGSCYSLLGAPSFTIQCEFGSIPPGNVAHANIIVRATTPGTHTNVAQDMLGNQAAATYTIVPAPRPSGGTSVSAGGASVRICPGGTSVRAGGASVTTGRGC
jgi:uncharacterized repeat protein (TIGR01451 family)